MSVPRRNDVIDVGMPYAAARKGERTGERETELDNLEESVKKDESNKILPSGHTIHIVLPWTPCTLQEVSLSTLYTITSRSKRFFHFTLEILNWIWANAICLRKTDCDILILGQYMQIRSNIFGPYKQIRSKSTVEASEGLVGFV